jgi:hypothetical protein
MGDANAPPLRASQLLGLLAAHEVRYVIIGGVAAIVHGASRATFDIDIVPEWTSANLDCLAAALREANARLRVPDAAEPIKFPIDAASLRQFEVSTWRTDYGDIDVVVGSPTSRRGELAGYAELRARAQTRHAYGLTIWVADLADVIESKRALSRDPDLAALPELDRLYEQRRHESQLPPHPDGTELGL